MRLRSSSIRARVIALLLVPIVALVGLWVYATMVTTGDFWSQFNAAATYKSFGVPVDQFASDLQSERLAAVDRAVRPGGPGVADAYQRAQAVTDSEVLGLQARASGSDAHRLDAAERARLQDVLAAAAQLPALRGKVGQDAMAWESVLGRYTDLVQPAFSFRSAFVSKQSGQLPRQGTILIELARAREYLSQEDAAMTGLQASAAPSNSQYQTVLDPMHDQQALFTVYIGELGQPDQERYTSLLAGPAWSSLSLAERLFQTAGDPVASIHSISAAGWHRNAAQVLTDSADLNSQLATEAGAEATSEAMSLLWRGLIAGLVGLAAIVLSLMISYRIGRGMARELIGLRNAANELAGVRLPSVMERLRRGAVVDIAVESPDLEFGEAEVGQLGRAFSAVQRTAVQAAVEQAELRRGVSAVFVNLARRSQVLLHRQLTLLDTMERRTEDPAELEDLFRLDHLTTRMRRHAEGLIILSGGSPGRAWRKPVRMVDVVRAAVAEVEDYARVVVRPFPGTGLLGSSVADVTHLIAELVENAAVFSPPHTQVTVQGEVVAHGFALEIDDRGLGLSEQALAEINERLEVEQPFDLADTDRLGLFVVSRLARRHGVRVHLRPSAYGGTSAVVVIPRELLAEVPSATPEPPAPEVPAAAGGRPRELVAVAGGAPGGAPGQRRRPEAKSRNHQRTVTGPQPAGSEPSSTPGGLPRRRAGGGPTLVPSAGATGRHRREESDPAQSQSPSAGQTGPTGLPRRRGGSAEPSGQPQPAAVPGAEEATLLPRRVRQANLAPQLREAAGRGAGAGRAEQPARERSPEEARATFSSFQRGFSRGRAEPQRAGDAPRAGDPRRAADAQRSAEARSPADARAPWVAPPAFGQFGQAGQAGQPSQSSQPGQSGQFGQETRRALTSAPVPPALPAAPVPAPPASAEGHDR